MKKSRFTEEQIVHALRQDESGNPAVEVCRNLAVIEQACSHIGGPHHGSGST